MMEFYNYILSMQDQIMSLTLEHVELTLLAVFLAIAIGVPLGILISYVPKFSKPVLGFANIAQAIPSMALLGFAIPFLGIGTKPAIFMVVLYSLLPIIKNTYTGVQSIPSQSIEAAKGIGLTRMQVLFKIQIPMALPIIMAGIRISAVSAVGLMTLAAFIGAGGLGFLVYSGIRTSNNFLILAGAIPACLLALFMDYGMGFCERIVVPQGLSIGNVGNEKKPVSPRTKKITLIITVVVCLVLAMNMIVKNLPKADNVLAIGSSDMTEQQLLVHLAAELIEDKTDIVVDRKLSLGGTQICFNATMSGDIGMYYDYSGTLYGDMLQKEPSNDADYVYNTVKKEVKDQYGLIVLDQAAFNDTYTLTVRKDTAQKYNLKTISDLEKVSGQLRITPTMAFNIRKEALPNMTTKYPNLKFKQNIAIDGAARYTALINNESEVIDAYSTDGLIRFYDLVVLEDDKNYFLPYYGIPIINSQTQEKFPEIIPIVNELGTLLNNDVMMEMNYQVDVLKREPPEVAKEFLIQQGLLK